jgi:hypothetical protein
MGDTVDARWNVGSEIDIETTWNVDAGRGTTLPSNDEK